MQKSQSYLFNCFEWCNVPEMLSVEVGVALCSCDFLRVKV